MGWYYEYTNQAGPFTYLVFGDGSMIAPPPGFPVISPPASIQWRGDVGEGIERDWEFVQGDEARLGSQAWWRSDLNSLWNRRLDEVITPPSWMPQAPGQNEFVRWAAVPILTPPTKRGKVRINGQQRVLIEVTYLVPVGAARLAWYAENRSYQVWPPYVRGG